MMLIFFFSSRRRHTRFKCDWSSDVCSSDLEKLAMEFLMDSRLALLATTNCRQAAPFYPSYSRWDSRAAARIDGGASWRSSDRHDTRISKGPGLKRRARSANSFGGILHNY